MDFSSGFSSIVVKCREVAQVKAHCCDTSRQEPLFQNPFWDALRSASPKPHPSKPRPCNMPQAKNGSCAAIFGKLRCRKVWVCNVRLRFAIARAPHPPLACGGGGGGIQVKQGRFAKLAFFLQNGALWGPKKNNKVFLGRFALRFH